jgi:NAD(P)H-dependent FMN reductase
MPYPDSEYPSVLRGRDKRESQRLLAAAPELLASLKAAKNELIDLYEAAYPDDESENDTTAVIDRVIAAIDAAEGRA